MDKCTHDENDVLVVNEGTVLAPPKQRNIYFSSQVDQETISNVTRAIIEINSNDRFLEKQYDLYGIKYERKPIKVYIDSYGGQIYSCLGLLSVIENSKTPIHTIVTGTAMSCGFLMAISGHKRFAYKYSTLMYHQVSSWSRGKIKDMQDDVVENQRLQDLIETITIKKTKIAQSALKDVLEKKKDWIMDSYIALQQGRIDAIIE